MAIGIADAQIELSLGVILLGGFAKPFAASIASFATPSPLS